MKVEVLNAEGQDEERKEAVENAEVTEAERKELDETTEQEGEKEIEGEGEEVTLTIEGAEESEPVEPAPKWVNELRRSYRELQKEKKELERKLKSSEAPATVELGPKPTLEASDYDTERFERALENWYTKKREADKEKEAEEARRSAVVKEWEQRVQTYHREKETLGFSDFEDAEATLEEILNETQRGIIVQGADSPAKVVYALYKYPEKAKELAQITDPVRFAVKVGELTRDVKMEKRKPATTPEKRIVGNASSSGAVESTLAKLREEAERTGDYTKLVSYKRKIRK